MFEKPFDQFEQWTKPGQEAFELWISMWPVAPLFGVEWRFAETMTSAMHLGREAAAATTEVMTEGPAAFTETSAVLIAPEPFVTEQPVKAPKPKAKKTAPKPAAKAKVAPEPAPEPVAVTPVVPEPVVEADPVVEAEPVAPAPAEASGTPGGLLAVAPESPDDLKLIKGIGPALEKQLNGLGVYRFSQIAAFSDADLEWIDDNLTAFKGRCFRDDWIGQAKGHV